MTGAPLPPHERAWRHPSELGRVVHEPPSARSHAIIVSTAAVGLLLVALLAVAMTPGGSPGQLASPAVPGTGDAASFASLAPVVTSTPAAPLATGPVEHTTPVSDMAWSTVVVTTSGSATTIVTTTLTASTLTMSTMSTMSTVSSVVSTVEGTRLDRTTVPAPPIESGGVAVPIDDGGLALMAQPDRAVSPGEAVTAELPSGEMVTAEVMATDESGLVVVSLPAEVGASYQVAAEALAATAPYDTVHVHGAETVTMEALEDLEVADGTPLTDDAGQLVGLCVEDRASGITMMLVIDRARVDAIDG